MELRDKVLKAVDLVSDEIWDLALYLHSHPEIGGEEVLACEKITGIMEKHGFSIEKGVAGLKTAFICRKRGRKDRPCVAFVAEYDALPDLGHACGHNLIAAMGAGAAIALGSVVEELNGSVALVGTPGEENIGGKAVMAEAGVFDQFDAALMAHPGDRNSLDQRLLALDPVKFVFKGRPAHSAVAPHLGRDALDAIVLFFNAVNALREHVPPEVRIHGIIVEAGKAPNVVPERSEARMYVRAPRREILNEITGRVVRCAEGAAIATECELEWEFYEAKLDDMVENKVLTDLYRKNAELLGIKDFRPHEGLGSSDVGNMSRRVPSIQPTVKIAPLGTKAHTKEFAEAAASEKARRAVVLAVKVLALTGLDLLTNEDLLIEAREELKRRLAELGDFSR